MSAVTNQPAVPASVALGTMSAERYPGLGEALEQLGRALSVAASRPVHVGSPTLRQVDVADLTDTDTPWFGGPGGMVVGLTQDTAPALAELLLGLRPESHGRPLSPVETRIVRHELLPLLGGVAVAVLTPGQHPGADLSAHTGEAALAALGRRSVVTTIRLPITAETETGSTVAVVVTVAVSADTAAPRRAGTVDLDNLTGALADIPLNLRVTLPPTLVSADVLVRLTAGDFLPLAASTDSPWLVWANETLLASASAGQVGDRRSIKTTTTWRQHAMNDQVLTGLAAAEKALDDSSTEPAAQEKLGPLGSVSVEVTAELGRVTMPFRDVVALHPGQVIPLDKAQGAPFTVLVNGVSYATAEVTTVGSRLGLRIVEVDQT